MTGLTGQIGSSVAALLAPGNEIIGLARYTKQGSLEAAEKLGVQAVKCDYTTGDFTGVPDDVDYVLHIAADTFPVDFDTGVHQNGVGTGLLFNHFRKAKSWIYVSTTGVYWDHPDPWHRYKETDRLGGSTRITSRFPYGPTKFAGEAVARTLSEIHQVPVTIPRMNWSYGVGGNGGLPGGLISAVYEGRPVNINPDWENVGSPIHENDFTGQLEGFFDAAQIGGNIVNWAGDDPTSVERLVPWIAQVIGKDYTFNQTREATSYPRATDNAKRIAMVGRCAVPWQEGLRHLIRHRYPDLQLRDAADPEPGPHR
ncbi:NAD(P)-dependent oxidoreductase [Sphingobium sp. Sx8-8]|uniref:NAD-dependent epimerase/dehydratase family protein n=1 Tax=Sphingobium sp. Sx8-8 TaxID=2933617 RepID=UPI001F59CAA6|nr:NAD(P)-dependent oxidoreductase [Sphingobium sp. Sx8-8]